MNNTAFTALRRALLALRRQPLALTGITVFAALITIALSGLPVVGTALSSFWMPFGAVLTGLAARDTLAGRSPTYRPLIDAVRSKRDRFELVSAGLVYAMLVELLTIVFKLLARDEMALWKMSEDGLGIETASILANIPWDAIVVAGALYVLFLMMTSFSPMLIMEARQSAGKSFFYSFFGTLRNFGTVALAVILYLVIFGGGFAAIEIAMVLVELEEIFLFVSPLLMAVALTVANALVWTLYEAVLSREPR